MEWTKTSAREWLDASWSSNALSVRALTWMSSRTIDHFEPQPLGERFQTLTTRPHECLREALRAQERFPDLRIVFGMSFRQERADGILHTFCVDAHDVVVDVSTKLYGCPELYLGVVLTDPAHVAKLAALNGLDGPLALR